MTPTPAIGFDLDLTLIDSRPGIKAVLDEIGAEFDVPIPSSQVVQGLGPPLSVMLEPYLPGEVMDAAVDRFRVLYPAIAVPLSVALPGAHEALAAARGAGARIVMVTGKFGPNARLHVAHLGFDVDQVVGELWGEDKAQALRDFGAQVYVGDHVHDVAGARAAEATSVSVLTGPNSRDELLAAGTDVVLDDLTQFPGWWTAWLAVR